MKKPSTKKAAAKKAPSQKETLSGWILEKMRETGLNAAQLQQKTGISDTAINDVINTNKSSWRTFDALIEVFGETMSREKAKKRFFVEKWLRDRKLPPKPAPTLKDVIDRFSKKRCSIEPEQFIEIFEAICPERPSFMVTIAAGQLPTMLDNQPDFASIRAAIKKAVGNGLKLLYLVPNAAKVSRLKEYGLSTAEADEYTNGYQELIDGIEHKDSCRLIACDPLDIATPHYVTALIGEATNYVSFYHRVIERGPASGGKTMLVPSDSVYELGIVRYVTKILKADNHDEFAKAFIRRMGKG